jgi:hypothetical protein
MAQAFVLTTTEAWVGDRRPPGGKWLELLSEIAPHAGRNHVQSRHSPPALSRVRRPLIGTHPFPHRRRLITLRSRSALSRVRRPLIGKHPFPHRRRLIILRSSITRYHLRKDRGWGGATPQARPDPSSFPRSHLSRLHLMKRRQLNSTAFLRDPFPKRKPQMVNSGIFSPMVRRIL